jgi:hypothetical protein
VKTMVPLAATDHLMLMMLLTMPRKMRTARSTTYRNRPLPVKGLAWAAAEGTPHHVVPVALANSGLHSALAVVPVAARHRMTTMRPRLSHLAERVPRR